jgi:hypothetical protein
MLFIFADSVCHWIFIQNRFSIYHDVAGMYRVLWAVAMFIVFGEGGLAAFFTFWLLFNIYLNLLRKLPITYLGEDSWLDRFESSVTPELAIPLKIFLAAQFWLFYFNLP